MKKTTRNNILRYIIAMVAVLVFLLIASLLCMGLYWLSDKTGLPIYTAVTIAGIFYAAWLISKSITTPDDKEEQTSKKH